MEQIFGKDRGSMRSFFRMLQKAGIPYLWIFTYIAITALLANVGISVTEYTAELFAGNVNFGTVVLPFLIFTLISRVIGSVSGTVMEDVGTWTVERINVWNPIGWTILGVMEITIVSYAGYRIYKLTRSKKGAGRENNTASQKFTKTSQKYQHFLLTSANKYVITHIEQRKRKERKIKASDFFPSIPSSN